jgi:hypothetical protein
MRQQDAVGTAGGGPVCARVSMADLMNDPPLLRVHVECYAGHRGEETPRALQFGERRIKVMDVLDQWLAPDHRYFKLRGDDGDVYLVRQDVASQAWELTLFQRGDRL